MVQAPPRTVEEMVKQYMADSEKLRQKWRDNPEEAKAFLIRAGVLVKSKSSPTGVRLAPDLR